MPRGTKESEDELEPKGRRTRAAAHSVTDSPLRRSTRNRQTPKDENQGDNSSPESVTSDAGPPTRTRRRITPTKESVTSEPVRTLRSRKTSAASDVSEAAESENGGEGRKRSTRRSSVVPSAIDTPTKTRLRRTTRAGSESKTISPMVRVTRRTRASSVDPDITDSNPPTTPSTPMRNRKQRASVLSSELPVLQEIKPSDNEDEDVFVVDEPLPSAPTSPTPSEPPKTTPPPSHPEKSPNTDEETREALEASLEALISTTGRASLPPPSTPQKMSDNLQKLMDNVNENTSKDLPKVLVEKTHIEKQETSPGNKENEKDPKNTSDRPSKLFKAATNKPMERKTFNTIVLERLDVESRLNKSVDDKIMKSRVPLKVLEKAGNLESESGDKEEKEESIIFIDDTDTDDAGIEASNDKSDDKDQVDDEIIMTPIASDDLSPCKSQFPKNRAGSPGDDHDDEDEDEEKVENPEETKEIDIERMETDSVDNNLKSLFKDIPADNWQNGGGNSPVNVEDDDDDDDKGESDGEFDLVLVGKGGWSDENEEEKKKENFNYDSDETVIVSKDIKSPGVSVIQEEAMEVDEEGETDVEERDDGKMELSQRKSINSSRKSKTPGKGKKSVDEDDDVIAPDVEDQLNKSREMIYAFESGIPIGESKTPGKGPKSEGEEILKRSKGSSGSRKIEVDEVNCGVEVDVDESEKSSEVQTSLSESKTPVNEGNSEDKEDDSNETRKNLSKSKSPGNNCQLQFSSDNEEETENKSSKIKEILSRKSVDGSKTQLNEKKDEISGVDEKKSSPEALENVDKSRKIVTLSELRVSLTQTKIPVKERESLSSEKEENRKLEDSLDKSKITPRNSLPGTKTPAKPQENDEESSSEDEDPEDISLKFNKSKTPEIKSSGIYDKLKSLSKGEEGVSSSSEEETPEEEEDDVEDVEEISDESKESTRRSSTQLETSSKQNEESSPAKLDKSLEKSDESSRRSSTRSKTSLKQNKESSPAKLDKSLKKSEETSPKKGKSLMKQSSSSEDEEDEEDDEDDEDNEEKDQDIKRSVSTIVQLNSDPEADDVSDSDIEQSRIVSSFLFAGEPDFSSSEMDSDIQKEYNLDGASNEEYSDDDVPGDDCLVSDSEESEDEDEDDDEDMEDFLNDDDSEEDEEEEEEEDNSEQEEETLEMDEDNEEELISPSKMKNKSKKIVEEFKETEKASVNKEDTSTPRSLIQDRKSESAKKNKTPKLSTPSRIIAVPVAESESSKKNKSSGSTPSGIIDLSVSKSVEKLNRTPISLPKKLKSGKKFEMNQTLMLDDSELVDTRLLMKEKLNDSMPILKVKRLSSRKSDLGVVSEDKSEVKVDEEMKELKKKVKLNKQKVSKGDILEEISKNEDIKKSVKRQKTKEIDSDVSKASKASKAKKNKIQLLKLADSDSDEPEVLSFHEARAQALVAREKELEGIRAIKEGKKNQKKSIKRLPEEILENLSDVPLRPKKKRKMNYDIFVPSRSMFDRGDDKPKGLSVDEEFVPISLSGGTTSFEVVNLKKKKKNSIRSFREAMMNRVSRHPISAYMAYQQKLKASGKNKY